LPSLLVVSDKKCPIFDTVQLGTIVYIYETDCNTEKYTNTIKFGLTKPWVDEFYNNMEYLFTLMKLSATGENKIYSLTGVVAK